MIIMRDNSSYVRRGVNHAVVQRNILDCSCSLGRNGGVTHKNTGFTSPLPWLLYIHVCTLKSVTVTNMVL